MRYFAIFFTLFLTVFLGACAMGAQKSYKQYQGISYDEYERHARQNLLIPGADTADIEDGLTLETDELAEEEIESIGASYGEAVVVMAAKRIFIADNATQKEVKTFQTALDAAYRAVVREFQPAGFTYAMSPAGAVNPLSTMDVQCLLGESGATSRGKEACDLFFKEAALEYEKAQIAAGAEL